MLDKDPLDDSQVRCGSRESSMGDDDEEQKALLSSGATGEGEQVGLDPASCQFDLVSDPNADSSELACILPTGTGAEDDASSDDTFKSEVMEKCANIGKSCVNDSATFRSVSGGLMPATALLTSREYQHTRSALVPQCHSVTQPNETLPSQCQSTSFSTEVSTASTSNSQQCQNSLNSQQFPVTLQAQQQFHLIPPPQQCHNSANSQPHKYTAVPHLSPPTPIVSQEQSAAGVVLQQQQQQYRYGGADMPVIEQRHSLIMPRHNQPTPMNMPPNPNAYLPQQYLPMVYSYQPQFNQPIPWVQYPSPPLYQHYQHMPMMQQYQRATAQPRHLHPICEGQTQQQTVALQQNQVTVLSQQNQPSVSNQNNAGIEERGLQNPAGIARQNQVLHHDEPTSAMPQCPPLPSEGYRQQNVPPASQHNQPGVMLQAHQFHCSPYLYQTPISEGQPHQQPIPSIGPFPSINPQPPAKPRVGVRLQGPHHLFTVVPVGSGELLKEAQEESSKTVLPPPSPPPPPPPLPIKTTVSPSKHFMPSLPPIMPTPPTSPVMFYLPNDDDDVSSPPPPHPLAGVTYSQMNNESISPRNTASSPTLSQMTISSVATSISSAKTMAAMKESCFPRKRISLPSRSPYHTITGMPTPPYNPSPREYGIGGHSSSHRAFSTGGLGLSPFHPRGEYGVGGLSPIRRRKESSIRAMPRNPYHTITGMVPPTHPMREYGIGGSSSPSFSYRGTRGSGGIPTGIPPSLVSVVMPKGVGGSIVGSRKSSGNLKRLSWGYTMADTRNSSGNKRSSSMRHLYTHPLSNNHLVEETSDGASSPLLLQPEQITINSANQLSVQSAQQMTVNSVGGLSIEVGSTDGRYLTVRGALTSPEQLPYLPAVFRHGHLEACSKGGPHNADGSDDGRQTWGNKAQFVLACIGYAVGLGNLWRFPYLCYKSGGGAFLIPYFLMLFLCGIPLLLMELAVGQYTRRGPIGALEKLCPFFKGAGVGTVIMSFLLGTYYNVIIAWAIYYLFQSFTYELPWRACDPAWAVNCFDSYGTNVTAPNGTKSPTEEYFDEVILQRSRGMEEMGSFRLELLLALFGAWVLVYFCLWKSVKSSGKVVYVTATLPYLLIGAFLWRALTLPGASTGLKYFFTPRWELLLDGKVWVAAAAQNFNSIGIAFGSLIAFSSYNKFNNNIVLDTWAISLTNAFTSLLAGMIVFSTLGNIALEQSKDMDEVVAEGPGLVFMVYPQALAKMPYGGIWAVLFFFMLLILGLDSQFANVEVIITSLQDGFPKWLKNNLKHHEILVLIVCTISLICGLPNVMQGGIYFFTLIDYYAANVSLMYLAFFEVVSIVWIYGAGRLSKNVQEMTGRMPSWYFRGCWFICAPILILAIWIFSVVDYEPPTYNKGEYKYPNWAIGIGWMIASLSIAPIPIFAVIAVIKAKGTNFWEKLKNSFRSQIEDCDCCVGTFNTETDDPNKGEFLDQVKLVVYKETENEEVEKNPSLDVEEERRNEKNNETELNGKTN